MPLNAWVQSRVSGESLPATAGDACMRLTCGLIPANLGGERRHYLIEPCPAGKFTVLSVSTFRHNVRNEGPECVENSL